MALAALQRSGLPACLFSRLRAAFPSCLSRPDHHSKVTDSCVEQPSGTSGTPLFGFLSLQRLLTDSQLWPGAASHQALPLRRSFRPCGLLSRSSSRGTRLIRSRRPRAALVMRYRPLSRQRSATAAADIGLVDPTAFRCWSWRASESTTLLGFQSLRSFDPAMQGETTFSVVSVPPAVR